MSYTPHEWTTGETITAAKLNALENGAAEGGSGYDAVIRLDTDASGNDMTSAITPSIVSGTFEALVAKIEENEPPVILVTYYNSFFGCSWSFLGVRITYYSPNASVPLISFEPFGCWYENNMLNIRPFGTLVWNSNEELGWD